MTETCAVSFREQTALCVSILERLLQAVEPIHLARNLRLDLQRGLTHPDDSVKTLTLSQVWNHSGKCRNV
jgi:26S proteasome non-ATPase regulatory subunit 5